MQQGKTVENIKTKVTSDENNTLIELKVLRNIRRK